MTGWRQSEVRFIRFGQTKLLDCLYTSIEHNRAMSEFSGIIVVFHRFSLFMWELICNNSQQEIVENIMNTSQSWNLSKQRTHICWSMLFASKPLTSSGSMLTQMSAIFIYITDIYSTRFHTTPQSLDVVWLGFAQILLSCCCPPDAGCSQLKGAEKMQMTQMSSKTLEGNLPQQWRPLKSDIALSVVRISLKGHTWRYLISPGMFWDS